jgi:hypothetical protein
MTVVNVRKAPIAWYLRRGYHETGETNPFPYGDDRFGTPQRDDLSFVVLEKDLTLETGKPMSMFRSPSAPIIRISLGFFDADKAADLVERKLTETRGLLEPGVRAMRGNLGYFVGIDRAAGAMHNVSLWETVEDANQMASFQPMLDLAGEFIALGVRFQRPILNCETLWSIEGG